MKNEVASLMKCGQTAWKSKRALLRASIASTSLQRSCRFMFAEQTLHLLKNYCTKWILFNWQSSKTKIFLLCFTLPTDPNSDSATHSHTAVNWLVAPCCLRQMKRCSEQEETTSIATRSSSSVAPYHSLSPLAKTHSLRTSSSPLNARILGHPPARRLCFWPYASLVRVQNGLAIHKLPEHHQLYMQPSCVRLNPITILPIWS